MTTIASEQEDRSRIVLCSTEEAHKIQEKCPDAKLWSVLKNPDAQVPIPCPVVINRALATTVQPPGNPLPIPSAAYYSITSNFWHSSYHFLICSSFFPLPMPVSPLLQLIHGRTDDTVVLGSYTLQELYCLCCHFFNTPGVLTQEKRVEVEQNWFSCVTSAMEKLTRLLRTYQTEADANACGGNVQHLYRIFFAFNLRLIHTLELTLCLLLGIPAHRFLLTRDAVIPPDSPEIHARTLRFWHKTLRSVLLGRAKIFTDSEMLNDLWRPFEPPGDPDLNRDDIALNNVILNIPNTAERYLEQYSVVPRDAIPVMLHRHMLWVLSAHDLRMNQSIPFWDEYENFRQELEKESAHAAPDGSKGADIDAAWKHTMAFTQPSVGEKRPSEPPRDAPEGQDRKRRG